MKEIKIINGTYGYRPAPGVVEPKNPESPAFFAEDKEAERLVGLGVAEYVNDLGCEEVANDPQNDAGDGSEDGKSDDRLTAEALEKWDYNDIKALAADMGVTPEGKKKSDYINAILAAQDESETDEDDEDGLPTLSAADPE